MRGHVEALASADFTVRTRASRALVAMGEDAITALESAGERPVAGPGGLPSSSTRPVVEAILGLSADEDLLGRHLGSPAPFVRAAAAEELGRRGRWAAVPRLIERLEDEDPGVRGAAVASLRRLTNRFEGGGWREWWNREGRHIAARGGPGRG